MRIYSKAAAVQLSAIGPAGSTRRIRTAGLRHYVERVGLHEVSREPDGRAYLRAWDEFDRHSIVLRPAETPGMDYVGFKVAGEADLNAFAHRIETVGTEVEEVPAAAELCRADRSPRRVVCRDGALR